MILNNIATLLKTKYYGGIRQGLQLVFLLTIFCSSLPTGISYASDNSLSEFNLPAENVVYDSNIKTIEIRRNNSVPSYPLIELGSTDQLSISFDDLAKSEDDYYFKVIHCTHNWQQSDLISNEYISGFPELLINNYEPSFTSSIPYMHYEFTFPNDMMSPTLSGNYLLVVYTDGNEDLPAFTARIIVYEQLVRYRVNVKESSIIKERTRSQEVDFDMVYNGYQITRPYEDIHQVILQNFNWNNAISDLEPVFVKNSELTYDYGEENNFSGGNEYRFLSIASLENITNQIDSIGINSKTLIPEVFLKPDESKAYKLYTTLPDINGDFRINSQLGFNDDLEAEYCSTLFSLKMDTPLSFSSKIYVYGNFTFNQLNTQHQMSYNYMKKRYELELLLKQGFYNYKYVVLANGEYDHTYFEGSHFQTENDFHIFSYDSNPSLGYDRVIGFYETNTFNE